MGSDAEEAHYDAAHQPKHLEVGHKVYLKLGDGYMTPTSDRLPPTLRSKYVGRFKVLGRVGRLAYKLESPPHCQVHRGIQAVLDGDEMPSEDDILFAEFDTYQRIPRRFHMSS